jgi:hypothetical protein
MSLIKYASANILDFKTSSVRLPRNDQTSQRYASLNKEARPEDDYLYVRVRAISSRVNKNNDGWPSEELRKSYKTFLGRPVFVDHNNSDPTRARGVVISSRLITDAGKRSALDPYYASAPANHLPPVAVELILEVDAKTFPKLAKAIRTGKIDSTSMGANIQKSICSVCGTEAETPAQYCSHVKQKGATFEITSDNGERVRKRAYEDCYGVTFFEDSFVFDPADETALVQEHLGSVKESEGIFPATQYPQDDESKNQVLQLTQQIAEAAQAGNRSLVQQLQQQLEQLLGGQPSQYHQYAKQDDIGQIQKGAPYPSDSYKNSPDHSPKGQEWPAEVNAVYNACMRDNGKEGDEASKEKCAKIAWAQYHKTVKDKGRGNTKPEKKSIWKRADADDFHDEVERLRGEGEIPERAINQLPPEVQSKILQVATKAFMNTLHSMGGGDYLSGDSEQAYSNAFIGAKRAVEQYGYDSSIAADAASAAKVRFQTVFQGEGADSASFFNIPDFADMPEEMKGNETAQ